MLCRLFAWLAGDKNRRPGRWALSKAVANLCTLALVSLVSSASQSPAAHAAFPGANGKIAFASDRDGNYEITR